MSADSKIEYVELDNDEIWRIDYGEGYAMDISDYQEKTKNVDKTKYNGTIDKFLSLERGCKDIHFHDSIAFPRRIHIKKDISSSKNPRCTFTR